MAEKEKRELNEQDKLFVKNVTELVADAKKLPASEALAAVIDASEEALGTVNTAEEVSHVELDALSKACKAMTFVMDAVKGDDGGSSQTPAKEGDEGEGDGAGGKQLTPQQAGEAANADKAAADAKGKAQASGELPEEDEYVSRKVTNEGGHRTVIGVKADGTEEVISKTKQE